MAKEIKCEVGEIYFKGNGKMVARVSWNGRPETIDIRRMNEEGDPLKGISLKQDELDDIIEALKQAKKSESVNSTDKRMTVNLREELKDLGDIVNKRIK